MAKKCNEINNLAISKVKKRQNISDGHMLFIYAVKDFI